MSDWEAIVGWFKAIPPFTRIIFIFSILIPTALHFSLINAANLIWSFEGIKKFQFWRIFSPFFLSSLSISTAYSVWMRYKFGKMLESSAFAVEPGDFCFFFICFMAVSLAAGNALGVFLYWNCLTIALINLWALHNPSEVMQFMFGIRLKAAYLPYALIAMEAIQRQPITDSCIGLAVSYGWFYITEIYPKSHGGRRLIGTPSFLINMFRKQSGRKSVYVPSGSHFTVYAPRQSPSTSSQMAANAEIQARYRPFSGEGRKLGDEK